MTILAAVGLAKEARIAARAGLKPVIGAANVRLLAQRLRAEAEVSAVVSFGIAGALAPLLKAGDAVVATHVVTDREHYACDAGWSRVLRTALAGAQSVVIAGVDTPAGHVGAKKDLFRETGAHAVDMESHIAARFAAERGVPFAVLRVISDAAGRTLPPAALERLSPGGKPRLFAILKSLLLEPGQTSELVQAAREVGTAFRELARCRDALGRGLGFPYLR